MGFRLAIGSERVVVWSVPLAPPLRSVAGDEQPEAMNEDDDEEESTWTSLDMVE